MDKKLTSVILSTVALLHSASSVAALPAMASSLSPKVKCVGANACQGHSACKTETSECSGQNICKGKGWLLTTKKECKKLGGKAEKLS